MNKLIKFKNLYENAEKEYFEGNNLFALQFLNNALSLGCTFPKRDIAEAYQLRGWIKYCLEDFEKGIDDINESIYLNPKDDKSFYFIGLIESINSNHKDALNNFDIAIKLKPKISEYFYRRGESNYNLGHYEEAIKDFDKAIELNPQESDYFNMRGNSYVYSKRYEEAKKDFDKAIELNPQESDHF